MQAHEIPAGVNATVTSALHELLRGCQFPMNAAAFLRQVAQDTAVKRLEGLAGMEVRGLVHDDAPFPSMLVPRLPRLLEESKS